MITYKVVEGMCNGRFNRQLGVFLDGKRIGTIKRDAGGFGYFYQPKSTRMKLAGDVFKTIDEVKRSLEAE